MAILIESTDVEEAVSDHAKKQPVRTSKTALAEAILRRAALNRTPEELDAWLRNGNSRPDPTGAPPPVEPVTAAAPSVQPEPPADADADWRTRHADPAPSLEQQEWDDRNEQHIGSTTPPEGGK